jgi:hypothetical protein
MGMAEIFEMPDGEFHAVLHKMSEEDMQALDKMERGYIRKNMDCYLYDGTHVVATGYQFDRSKLTVDAARPPSERYVDLMVQGMVFHGCDLAAIEEMKNTPDQTPRRKPEEYQMIEVHPDCLDEIFSWPDIHASDGLDNRPLRVVFNGKVMQFTQPSDVPSDVIAQRYQNELKNAGTDITHIPNKILHDPLFPLCSSIDEMLPEHILFAEDNYWRRTHVFPPVYFICVGIVK